LEGIFSPASRCRPRGGAWRRVSPATATGRRRGKSREQPAVEVRLKKDIPRGFQLEAAETCGEKITERYAVSV